MDTRQKPSVAADQGHLDPPRPGGSRVHMGTVAVAATPSTERKMDFPDDKSVDIPPR